MTDCDFINNEAVLPGTWDAGIRDIMRLLNFALPKKHFMV